MIAVLATWWNLGVLFSFAAFIWFLMLGVERWMVARGQMVENARELDAGGIADQGKHKLQMIEVRQTSKGASE